MKSKNLITVVTDTQYTADSIAKAIGATQKHSGYFLGNGYAVVWTNGEVIEATFKPAENFVLSTTMDCRLVYAHNYKLAMRDYDVLIGYKKSAQDKAQLATIKALWSKSRVVVNAMTPDIDGDCAFLNLYYFIGIPVEVRRAWLTKLTNKCIRHGVNHGPIDRKAYEKWLEESIYNRLVKDADATAELKGAATVEEIDIAEAAAVADCAGLPAPVPGEHIPGDHHIGIISVRAPLFNLPALLIQCACELGFGHDKTIQTAYRLYAKKLISYPMTMQNTIPAGVWKEMKDNIGKLRLNTKWGKEVRGNRLSRSHNFRNGENVYNGHGIVTTGLHPVDLSRDEELLYNLIVKRVIDALSLPALKRSKKRGRKRGKADKALKAAATA